MWNALGCRKLSLPLSTRVKKKKKMYYVLSVGCVVDGLIYLAVGLEKRWVPRRVQAMARHV